MNSDQRSYRTLHFLVEHGAWVAAAAGVVVLLAGLGLWVASGSAWFMGGGVVGAAFIYLIMQSYVELVRVIVDMLLPK